VGASPWHALQGLRVDAYEIHQGQSVWADPTNTPAATVCDASGHIMGWQQGAVLGVYAHGLFEAAPVMQALFGQHVRSLDAVFDGLADFIDQHFAPGVLMDLLKD
jgi:adenosylcobyric acid synthase